jgi:hypothetical protein
MVVIVITTLIHSVRVDNNINLDYIARISQTVTTPPFVPITTFSVLSEEEEEKPKNRKSNNDDDDDEIIMGNDTSDDLIKAYDVFDKIPKEGVDNNI